MPVDGIGDMLVTSRSFDEYVAMFALTDRDLSGTILDCPAGAASFGAIARRHGATVTSCDVAYGEMSRTLSSARDEVRRGHRYVQDHSDRYAGTFFTDADHHLTHRLAAADDFVDDATLDPGAYVAGSLPDLPFTDGAFDLVLSSHLLFTYDDRLDEAAHLGCLRELIRVARREVRVFPLVSHITHGRCRHLEALRAQVRRDGIETAVVDVDYGFEDGARQMLVCRLRT